MEALCGVEHWVQIAPHIHVDYSNHLLLYLGLAEPSVGEHHLKFSFVSSFFLTLLVDRL